MPHSSPPMQKYIRPPGRQPTSARAQKNQGFFYTSTGASGTPLWDWPALDVLKGSVAPAAAVVVLSSARLYPTYNPYWPHQGPKSPNTASHSSSNSNSNSASVDDNRSDHGNHRESESRPDETEEQKKKNNGERNSFAASTAKHSPDCKMLLAAPLPVAGSAGTAPTARPRPRPKLSLQITPLTVNTPITPTSRTPFSALSPTSRNTQMNRQLTAPSPASSASSSSSDDSPDSPDMKDKRRRRRFVNSKKAMSLHQPSTPAASFMPARQPETRGRELCRERHVGFCDDVVVHYLPEEEEDEDADDVYEKPTAMERAMELERLKEWVKAHGETMGDEESSEWVRKLVELEMGEIEKEEEGLAAESPCAEKKSDRLWSVDAEEQQRGLPQLPVESDEEEEDRMMVCESSWFPSPDGDDKMDFAPC